MYEHSQLSETHQRAIAVGMAMLGGLVGILGAVIEESKSFFALMPFLGAPIVEEALKPAGLYFMLGKWPYILRSQLYTACLAAVAGVSFAIVENLVYLYIYFPEHTESLVRYRFTVGLLVHALASFIYGFGINEKLVASVRGDIPFLSGSKRYFVAAMLLHAVYNTAVIVASATGWLKLE